MRYLKRFNESRDVTILQKLSKALEQNIDYDFDRDYDYLRRARTKWNID